MIEAEVIFDLENLKVEPDVNRRGLSVDIV